MTVSGDWVTPRFNDLKYFEKPPLQYWATAAAYEVFGVHEWSSRLWSTGLAFACLPLVFAWVARLFDVRRALTALLALGVSPYFALIGHINLLDAAFTFWLTAAVFAFTLAQCAPRAAPAERRWMLIAWAAAALAVLSKGIVVGVLAGGALVLYTLIERDTLTWRRLHVVPGLALFLLIAAPWFVLVTLRNPSFPGFFFVHEHFARFLTTVHQRVEPWWYFLAILAVGVLPWLPPLWRALRHGWPEEAQPAAAGAAAFRPLKFLVIFSAVTLAFFSASGSKLAPYILPIVPPLAAVCAARAAEPGAFIRGAARISAALMSVAGLGLLIYTGLHDGFVPRMAITWTLLALIIAAAGVWLTRARAALMTGVCASALAGILGWQFLMNAFAAVAPAHTSRDLADIVRPLVRPGTALYSIGQYRESLSPYLGRTLQLVAFKGELEFGLNEEPAKGLTLEQFAARWDAAADAVAFFDPGLWDEWRRRGLPGRVIAADQHTVIVSRL